ncbi:MAG TPA: hypothetical protein VG223_08320, partial [Solirubrobacteraceae bacterium]|nr:hypothetical protein [Solirubrobacteraceae bacterium]
EDQLVLTLEKDGLLSPLSRLQYNAYPKPGSAAHPEPFSGTYPRIQEDPPYRLPRGVRRAQAVP